MYLRAQPTEGGLRIQSYSHSLTTEFMGDWSPATPTGLNTSHDYQPDGLVVWPYEGIYIGIGNVFNTADQVAASGAVIGQVNMVLGWSAGDHDRLRRQAPSLAGLLRCSHRRRCAPDKVDGQAVFNIQMNQGSFDGKTVSFWLDFKDENEGIFTINLGG